MWRARIEGVDDVFEAATRASMLMPGGASSGAAARRATASADNDGEGKCCIIC